MCSTSAFSRRCALVPRERFVPRAWRELSFADCEIPLPCGKHMLRPMLVGRHAAVARAAAAASRYWRSAPARAMSRPASPVSAATCARSSCTRDLADAARAATCKRRRHRRPVEVVNADGLQLEEPRATMSSSDRVAADLRAAFRAGAAARRAACSWWSAPARHSAPPGSLCAGQGSYSIEPLFETCHRGARTGAAAGALRLLDHGDRHGDRARRKSSAASMRASP